MKLLQLRLLLRLLLLGAIPGRRDWGREHVGATDEAGGLLGSWHVHGDAILGQELVQIHVLKKLQYLVGFSPHISNHSHAGEKNSHSKLIFCSRGEHHHFENYGPK